MNIRHSYYSPDRIAERMARLERRLEGLAELEERSKIYRLDRKAQRNKRRAQRFQRILKLRGQGLSQAQVARRLGLTRQRVHQILSENPPLIAALAQTDEPTPSRSGPAVPA